MMKMENGIREGEVCPSKYLDEHTSFYTSEIREVGVLNCNAIKKS